MKRNYLTIIVAGLGVIALCGCVRKDKAGSDATPRNRILLSQAQFNYTEGPDGRRSPVPGPARLEILTRNGDQWDSEVIEDTDSNVFHKAMTAESIGFPGRILTIGGNGAYLKLWRKESGRWQADVLWHPEFGGKQNRLRDLKIGDVNRDGKPEMVIATHDQGVIAVLQGSGLTWTPTELCRTPSTFVHEVEIGDLNGNGINEIYATPSAPNKMDGTIQPGKIVTFEFQNGAWTQGVVEEFPERHVKEIMIADSPDAGGIGKVLYAALEAETAKAEAGGDKEKIVNPVKIKQYHYKDGAYQGRFVAEFQDRQCRFLNSGDVRHQKRDDLVASGFKSGLWLLEVPADAKADSPWNVIPIDTQSSGYEHATMLADYDGSGNLDIFVAADDQHALSRYTWKNGGFEKTTIHVLKDNTITFGLMLGKV